MESDDDVMRVARVGMRENPWSREWWREKACPSDLLPDAAKAVQEAIGRGNKRQRGALRALPAYPGDQDATPSVKADALADWLQSEDAALWRLDRKALFNRNIQPDISSTT